MAITGRRRKAAERVAKEWIDTIMVKWWWVLVVF